MKIERHLKYKIELEPEEYEIISFAMSNLESVTALDNVNFQIINKMEQQMEQGKTECVPD